MNASEIARAVMKASKVTQKDLADKYGKAGPSTISMILQSKSMRIDSFLMILNECGYELVVHCKDGSKPDYVVGDDLDDAVRSPAVRDNVKELMREVVSEELEKRGIGKPLGLKYGFDDMPTLPEDL